MKILTKVVLDTNILISAIVFGGKPREVLEAAIKGQIQLVPTEDIIREMKGILKGKKSRYPTEITDLIIQELEALAEIVKQKVKITVIEKNPEDDGVPECAHELQADFFYFHGQVPDTLTRKVALGKFSS